MVKKHNAIKMNTLLLLLIRKVKLEKNQVEKIKFKIIHFNGCNRDQFAFKLSMKKIL